MGKCKQYIPENTGDNYLIICQGIHRYVCYLGGYGSKTFEPVKKLSGNKALFPMVLGRDYSGVVVDVGQGIPNSVFKPGDEVWFYRLIYPCT